MTPAGSPAIVARAAKDAIAPPGIPGVPTDRSTFAKSTSHHGNADIYITCIGKEHDHK